MATSSERKLATEMLGVVMEHQRLARTAACADRDRPCERCAAAHLDRVTWFMERGEPVQLVLPGFPGKSPNPGKVLGNAPDMAERLSLSFLAGLCARIEKVYSPGARITICSDGRVFTDVVHFSDEDVTVYGLGMRALIDDLDSAERLGLFNLEEQFPDHTHESLRALLLDKYAESLDDVKAAVHADGDALRKYRGLTKFLFQDMLTPSYTGSRRSLQQRAREAAYLLLQRSDAWSRLVDDYFPHAVRLSIHPQPCGSSKLGVHMIGAADNWLTPWHGAAVDVDGSWVLMHRGEAEQIGAELVQVAGRPSHYRAKGTSSAPASQPESRLVS